MAVGADMNGVCSPTGRELHAMDQVRVREPR